MICTFGSNASLQQLKIFILVGLFHVCNNQKAKSLCQTFSLFILLTPQLLHMPAVFNIAKLRTTLRVVAVVFAESSLKRFIGSPSTCLGEPGWLNGYKLRFRPIY